jgi:nitroreductase
MPHLPEVESAATSHSATVAKGTPEVTPHPAFDADRWLGAVTARRSRRAFDGRSVSGADLDAIEATAEQFRPFDDARVEFVREAPGTFFTGIIGSYGKVTGAPSALVFIVDDSSGASAEHCGYTGEGVLLEANARGLTTCWIAGFFSRSTVTAAMSLAPREVVRAISPVGYAVGAPTSAERRLYGAAKPKRRRGLDEIAPGHGQWPAWAAAGLEAARIAPSAMNRQPWRFRMEDGAMVVSTAGRSMPLARLDCGIAMLHFELGARSEGCDGTWEPMSGHDVARWVPLG